mmetsp:Transcript_46697/g.108854  ORF Transcript_46697/g.108854 Transcript_46697/m.108854 type:complete len:244 (+) Transcript_46697:753-1484(+)
MAETTNLKCAQVTQPSANLCFLLGGHGQHRLLAKLFLLPILHNNGVSCTGFRVHLPQHSRFAMLITSNRCRSQTCAGTVTACTAAVTDLGLRVSLRMVFLQPMCFGLFSGGEEVPTRGTSHLFSTGRCRGDGAACGLRRCCHHAHTCSLGLCYLWPTTVLLQPMCLDCLKGGKKMVTRWALLPLPHANHLCVPITIIWHTIVNQVHHVVCFSPIRHASCNIFCTRPSLCCRSSFGRAHGVLEL